MNANVPKTMCVLEVLCARQSKALGLRARAEAQRRRPKAIAVLTKMDASGSRLLMDLDRAVPGELPRSGEL